MCVNTTIFLSNLAKVQIRLDTVSTVRGSGWVRSKGARFVNVLNPDGLTHPLPRTVLTVSKHSS